MINNKMKLNKFTFFFTSHRNKFFFLTVQNLCKQLVLTKSNCGEFKKSYLLLAITKYETHGA